MPLLLHFHLVISCTHVTHLNTQSTSTTCHNVDNDVIFKACPIQCASPKISFFLSLFFSFFLYLPFTCVLALKQTEPPVGPIHFFLKASISSPWIKSRLSRLQPHYILSNSVFTLENIQRVMIEPGSLKPDQSVTYGEWLAASWNSYTSWV